MESINTERNQIKKLINDIYDFQNDNINYWFEPKKFSERKELEAIKEILFKQYNKIIKNIEGNQDLYLLITEEKWD